MNINSIISLAVAANLSATTNSPGVDVSNFTGKCMIVLDAAATGGANHTLSVKLQHCDTVGGTYEDADVAFTQVTNAAASFQVIEMDVDGFKKFVRVVSTLAGTTPTAARSVTLAGKLA